MIRFGIIGAGNMGRVYALALTTQVEGGPLVAITGGRLAASLAAETGATFEPSVDDLLARSDVDAVFITTPHSTHLDLAERAALAGKHVYLEKPMAMSVEECDRIIAACADAGVALTVAKQTRHFEMSLIAKRLIDEGEVGDVRYLRPLSVIARTSSVAAFVGEIHWRYPDEGDNFLDWGAHCCDAIRWFTGAEPVRVYADYEDFDGWDPSKPHGQTSAVQFRLSSGAIAQCLLTLETPSLGSGRNNQYLIAGSKGTIFWDLDRCDLVVDGTTTRTWDLPSWTIPDFQPDHPRRIGNTARQIQGFIEDLEASRPPRVSGADGRAAIEMTQAASLSAATGQAVPFPLVVPPN